MNLHRFDVVLYRRAAARKRWLYWALALLLLAGPVVHAAAGDLDPTFGVNGIVTTDFPGGSNEALAVAIQSDGKIVAAGSADTTTTSGLDFAVARYNSDGTLDPSFGTGGVVTTDVAGGSDTAYALVLQPDGRIVVAGQSDNDIALARYLATGGLDSSFGTGGLVVTDVAGGGDEARAIVRQADGKLVVAGTSGDDFVLVRYTASGSLDPTFGTGGAVTTDISGGLDAAYGLALQSDGKLVVAGSNSDDFVVVRYTTSGGLDATFGAGGIVTTDFAGDWDAASGVALQSNGKLVVGGAAWTAGGTYDFAVARYNSNGSLDSTFGSGGKVTTDLNGDDTIYGLVIQGDGKIVAAGSMVDWGFGEGFFGLARYNTNGSLDSTFGSGGRVTSYLVSSDDLAAAVALQIDGKIVAAGSSSPGRDFTLARYHTNGSLDPSFDGDGALTTGFPGGEDVATALITQPDGKLVAAGGSGDYFVLARYNPDGNLDSTFGVGGKAVIDIPGDGETANALIRQPDGKLVAAGSAYTGTVYAAYGRTMDLVLARYNPDGSLDAGFGNGGIVTTNIVDDDVANALIRQPDGKLVAAGSTGSLSTRYFLLVRYNADGSLDPTFGVDGQVTTPLESGWAEVRALAIQPDGKLLAAGSSSGSFVLARYDPDGGLDPTFGADGIVVADVTSGSDEAYALGVQPDGKLVVAGVGGTDFLLLRYAPDGVLDPTFGTNGVTTTDLAGRYDEAHALVLQADGKSIVAGNSGAVFALARYTANGSLDSSFGSGGTITIAPDDRIAVAYALALQADCKVVAAGGYWDFFVMRYLNSMVGCADFNGSGGVDAADVQAIASRWHQTNVDAGWDDRFDLDRDSLVGLVDVMRVAMAWNSP